MLMHEKTCVIAIFSIRVESTVDPDQMALLEAICSGSTYLLKRIYPVQQDKGEHLTSDINGLKVQKF